MPMKSICVYCGSAPGRLIVYADAARALAGELVRNELQLVYGGGKVGLMGILADEVLRLGGQAIGVIPQALLEREVGHDHLTELHVVADMHERKALMAELSDAFIALPGGIGTLEELFEMFTWSQLGYHKKPVALCNIAAYYDGLLTFLQHAVDEQFLQAHYLSSLIHATDPATVIAALLNPPHA